jgi:hypothetical protein
VENNIKRRMELIIEAWEMSKSMVYFGTRAHAFHEYMQADIKNEKGFYLDVVVPFGVKFTGMMEFKRRQEHIPSPDRPTKCMLERKGKKPEWYCSSM